MVTSLRKGFYVFDLFVLGLMEISLMHTFYASGYLLIVLMHYLELLRFNSTFLLYRREKMAIWPILFFTVVFGFFFVGGMLDNTIHNMAKMPEILFGTGSVECNFYSQQLLERNVRGENAIRLILIWAWLMPIVTYLIEFVCKKTNKNGYSWQQLAGLAIFYDKAGKLFVKFCVLMFIALLAGVHMQQGISYYAVLILPTVAYYFVNAYIGRKAHWLEYVLIVIAMLVFNKAQYRFGNERVFRLVLSPAIILSVCVWMLAKSRKMAAAAFSFVMIAFVLPISSVGYNIYKVLDGARAANYTDMDTHYGVMYVRNSFEENGQTRIRFGMRDRYGQILPCSYRSIYSSNPTYNQVTCRTDDGSVVYDISLKRIVHSYSVQDSSLNAFVNGEILEPLMHKGYTEGQAIIIESETGKIRSMAGFTDPLGGKVNFSEPIKCSGLMMPISLMATLGSDTNVYFPDSIADGNQSMTIEEALIQESYNGIGKAVKKAYGKDINRFWWNLQEFGFCHYLDRMACGIDDIDTIRYCEYPSYEVVDENTIERLAIGIDRPVTALQMLKLYNVIANNGKEYKPLLYEDFVCSRESKLGNYDSYLFKEIFKKSFDATCKKFGVQNHGASGYYTTYTDSTDAAHPVVYTNVCCYTTNKNLKHTFILALKGDLGTNDRKAVLEGIMKLVDRL